MMHTDEAGLDDAKFYMLHRMPWGLSRPRFMDYQRKHIEEMALARPKFPNYLRQAALSALDADDVEIIRRALAALAFVGTPADLPKVTNLVENTNTDLSKDAGTCVFEIELRHRGV
jgi:hypothetical protein